ncbi:MAG: single-stranded-DNA-specific exonuclease RecJ [Lachnospiraceae bacterium]|nr:single-stranded-DNA-specific exonuclease RecJ [Lachnospiraceae bacterium]
MAKWFVYNKSADFKGIGEKYNIDQVVARVLINRDVAEKDMAEYLNPAPEHLHDGSQMQDMFRGVSLIKDSIDNNHKIRIIGDYDVDGIQSTYILHQGLLRLGADVDYAIPDRVEDGYGINTSMVDKAHSEGVETIITCDNGIAAMDAIELAKEYNMTVVITDHHEIPYEDTAEGRKFILPPADAVINPHRQDCNYPFEKLCGAAVAWKFIEQLYIACGLSKDEAYVFVENAAFATVCDVMELVGENRTIVKLGLERLNNTQNLGMDTLIKRCKLDNTNLSAYHLGFVLGPCLNASGRLDSATVAIELLESTSPIEAARLAEKLQSLNEERKNMTEMGIRIAEETILNEGMENDVVLVVYLPDVHESVAGIIAGRIRERFERPVFILVDAADEDGVKGSGRSLDGYSMYDKMCECRDLLDKFGGHPKAAGLSLKRENVDILRQRLNEQAGVTLEDLEPRIHIDVPMPFGYISTKLIKDLDLLEPFGNGNSKPIFAQKNVRILSHKSIGKTGQYKKLVLQDQQGNNIDALYFGDADRFDEVYAAKGGLMDVLYYPQINEFRGVASLQIVVTDIA